MEQLISAQNITSENSRNYSNISDKSSNLEPVMPKNLTKNDIVATTISDFVNLGEKNGEQIQNKPKKNIKKSSKLLLNFSKEIPQS